MQSILIAEADDQALRARGDELLLDGFDVHAASTRSRAQAHLAQTRPDALLLGLLDSPAASLALLRALRAGDITGAEARIPVLAVGADTDLGASRLYQAGADIVVPRASSPMLIKGALDLLAARTDSKHQRRLLRSGRLTVDCDARVASIDNTPVMLTRLEFDLLQTLASEPHRTFAKSELVRDVWGYEPLAAGIGRSVDTHTNRLRQKLRSAGPDDLIQTVRGVGYRLTR
jgi:DNA-binding response OmpR family regulator